MKKLSFIANAAFAWNYSSNPSAVKIVRIIIVPTALQHGVQANHLDLVLFASH